jgi:hypothetical protein
MSHEERYLLKYGWTIAAIERKTHITKTLYVHPDHAKAGKRLFNRADAVRIQRNILADLARPASSPIRHCTGGSSTLTDSPQL